MKRKIRIQIDARTVEAEVDTLADGSLSVTDRGAPSVVRLDRTGPADWRAALPDGSRRVALGALRGGRFLWIDGVGYEIRPLSEAASGGGGPAGGGKTLAPMPGIVRQVLVAVGDAVKQGQAVARMEAMKMEVPIVAGRDGTVKEICAKPGQIVDAGAELIRIEG